MTAGPRQRPARLPDRAVTEAYPEPIRRSFFNQRGDEVSPIDNDNYFFNVSHTMGERVTCSLLRGAEEVLGEPGLRAARTECTPYANDAAMPDGRRHGDAPTSRRSTTPTYRCAATARSRPASAKVDATWHVGASAGQYASTDDGRVGPRGEHDPSVAAAQEPAVLRRAVPARGARDRDRGHRRRAHRDRQERHLHPAGPALAAHRADPRGGRLRHRPREPDDRRHAQPLVAVLLDHGAGRVGLPGRLRRALLRVLRAADGARPSSRRPATSKPARIGARRSSQFDKAHRNSPARRSPTTARPPATRTSTPTTT